MTVKFDLRVGMQLGMRLLGCSMLVACFPLLPPRVEEAVFHLFLIVVTLAIVWLSVDTVFILVDRWRQPMQSVTGKVIHKDYRQFDRSLAEIFQTSSWHITLAYDGDTKRCPVSEHVYEALPVDALLDVKYIVGRFLGSKYLRGIGLSK
jgi:hypothetical protein